MQIIFENYKFGWTDEEITTVKDLINQDYSITEVANSMKENVNDVRLLVFWLVECKLLID